MLTWCEMQRTISSFDHRYLKLRIEPREVSTLPADAPILVSLLQKAALEAFGSVGAGATSALGNGMDVLWLQRSESASGRDAMVKLASSYIPLGK